MYQNNKVAYEKLVFGDKRQPSQQGLEEMLPKWNGKKRSEPSTESKPKKLKPDHEVYNFVQKDRLSELDQG